MMFYFIGMGSNQNPEANCQRMLQALLGSFDTIGVSSLEKTAAQGVAAEDYLNGVVCVRSDWTSARLRCWCKAVEKGLGREYGTSVCCADLDVLQVAQCPVDINVKAITEAYYQKLAQQLLILLTRHR